MGRRGYPAETRRRALELLAAGRGAMQVALTLNVSVQSVYRWRAESALADGAAQPAGGQNA